MKRVKIIFIAMLTIVSCQLEEEFQQFDDNAVHMTFYAGIELPDDEVETKTILGGTASDEYRKVLWESDDEVYVTNETYAAKFVNTSEEGAKVATLEGELSPASKYFAAYPFDIVTNYTSEGFNVNLPADQEYYENGIAPGTFPMVAKCNNGTFNFQNVCGIFVLQLLGDKTISAITFSGEGETGNLLPVAGNGIIPMDSEDVISLNFIDGAYKFVKLNCHNGVLLNNDTPTLFHIILPSGIYHNFKVVVEATDGSVMTITSSKPLRIKRSTRTTAAELTYDDVINLSEDETANCYIINSPGKYMFDATVKGNSVESIGAGIFAEVLWESFGTDIIPNTGDIIRNASFKGGYVKFEIPTALNEGNAVIAVKDASGTILWSWHIWVTDEPQEQVYFNGAGTMMDRNLGATSAIPGDVCAQGLLYQWGRKDPFLGSSSTTNAKTACSSIIWPSAEQSSADIGTIVYATNNPTTFITKNDQNNDWLYSGSSSTEHERWNSNKTIYDPCPVGWKVPNGGEKGIWYNVTPVNVFEWEYNDTNDGMDFSSKYGDSYPIWYPAHSFISESDGKIKKIGTYNAYWTVSPSNTSSCIFNFTDESYTSNKAYVYPYSYAQHADANAVRCIKDDQNDSSDTQTTNLSSNGTANSYIVSQAGRYTFQAVKGNSSLSVGDASSVVVLWESFGTDIQPLEGDLIKNVSCEKGNIYFETTDVFKEGNAVIAARNESGIILWSWHIWLTDQPTEQIYYNDAGTMMDRNLGATSAIPGDVGALGLLYKWGRKDPFLGSSSISSKVVAKSTITWPSNISVDTDLIEFSIANPTVFTSSIVQDDNAWTTSEDIKSIYDPCPPGWRVPDGGSNGVWAKALGAKYNSGYTGPVFDEVNQGWNFSNVFGSLATIWYPAAGVINSSTISSYENMLSQLSYGGFYWSASNYPGLPSYAFCMRNDYDEQFGTATGSHRGDGYSIRCIKDDSFENAPETGSPNIDLDSARDLSAKGSANSYIVSSCGVYSIPAVKGNSWEVVGDVERVEVLWESYGNATTPSKGDLITISEFINGKVYFKTSDIFNEGNVVIAAKDKSGEILWSWHIWLVQDEISEIQYASSEEIMMDRNLGSSNIGPDDLASYGLLYQWGRKDPFLGASSPTGDVSVSTCSNYPKVVSTSSTGTIDFAIKNPTSIIISTSITNGDWLYSARNDNLWLSEKTIYDPCPAGWRVPDGGESGIWANANFDNINFDENTGWGEIVINNICVLYPNWYYRQAYSDGSIGRPKPKASYKAGYWSATTTGDNACALMFDGTPSPAISQYRALGYAVRCQKDI